ncbi:Rieske (2Fe-2S) protein [Pseudomonas sp. 5P_3.1_Bac2]|uniref:Rieske (2Fe-2S) protein n=1 Tax=Pseudomonas sp. 5P_3.1_Bac2 TaxID=2971617 RepID=UPI0021C93F8D|nr:Rieske (2Fe-2S) protein [Pseudomonas sp. 5P_3.1_Bac2]MCU1718770.1 Rieske (2Fe-2S) protein [Pseudomonas sp. 5P_3.1_Bac2]
MFAICASQQLAEGQSRGFSIAGIDLVLVRKHGQCYAYRNRCPHRAVRLEWQADEFLDSSASLLQCAHHGALFLLESGECVAGPCSGQSLEALAIIENDGTIWLLPAD